jgi:hypothetical protein
MEPFDIVEYCNRHVRYTVVKIDEIHVDTSQQQRRFYVALSPTAISSCSLYDLPEN